MRRAHALLTVAILALSSTAACSEEPSDPGTTTTSHAPTTTTDGATPEDAGLAAVMLAVDDLPSSFERSGSVDDTITAFCAGQDATAGLQASAREIRGFTRVGGGASVIQLAFRFRDDGAAAFVRQAAAALEGCDGVPDLTGLAFEYEALTAGVEALIDAVSDDHVGRYGTNVGSGALSIEVVAFHHGDIGQLVAVLGLDLPRPELDELARSTFSAVAAKR